MAAPRHDGDAFLLGRPVQAPSYLQTAPGRVRQTSDSILLLTLEAGCAPVVLVTKLAVGVVQRRLPGAHIVAL